MHYLVVQRRRQVFRAGESGSLQWLSNYRRYLPIPPSSIQKGWICANFMDGHVEGLGGWAPARRRLWCSLLYNIGLIIMCLICQVLDVVFACVLMSSLWQRHFQGTSQWSDESDVD